MIFLTYNDPYSGIYQSQVIDVCTLFEQKLKVKTKLVALVSLRNYGEQRRAIRSAMPSANVLPMFPGVENWKRNLSVLRLFGSLAGEDVIWARGPFATNLALDLKKFRRVIFDARGAYQAELNEYNVAGENSLKKDIAAIEKKALFESDAQLAVSSKLAAWWQQQYAFTTQRYEVIPCTLADHFEPAFPSENEIQKLRSARGFTPHDVVLTYSGSSAGWQSFELVDKYLFELMSKHANIKLLFLSSATPQNSQIFSRFADRIVTKWVPPSEVRNLLLAADHGLLVREKSVTNQVASPVKFAEYLSCGLQVIISEGIGDFTEFVLQKKCGQLYSNSEAPGSVSYAQKKTNHELALEHFSKNSPGILKGYSALLGC